MKVSDRTFDVFIRTLDVLIYLASATCLVLLVLAGWGQLG